MQLLENIQGGTMKDGRPEGWWRGRAARLRGWRRNHRECVVEFLRGLRGGEIRPEVRPSLLP